jgi:serine/threonine protein kinase
MVSDAPSDELIGSLVGSYRIEHLIGEGAMGHVYRAADGAGQLVAVKVVRREIARDAVFRKRFEREARTAREVQNPHVVPVLDAGEHEGLPFLVQPFLPGSLEDRLAREQRLSIPDALMVAGQVADGLAAMAAQGMVHRDVKPPNVLLDGAGTALIADFGLVRDTKGTALTRVGQAIGSPHYMAPEQIRGEEVTSATDVYALGCVLCECLSGQPPFAAEQGMKVLWAQLTAVPPDPCAGLPDAPPGLGAAVLRALAKEVSERPSSAPDYVRSVCDAAGIQPSR